MNKFYAAREQRDASVGIAARRSVLQVALYGAAHVGKLATYLVMTTGEESHLKEHIVVRLGTQTVFQDGFLGTLALLVVSITLILLLIADEPVGECAFLRDGVFLDNSPIGLVNVARAEHLVQTRKGFGCAGKDNESAYGTVKTMHHAKEYVARLSVLHLYVFLHDVGERLVTGLVALYYLATCLVDDDDMIVFVDYLHL